MNLILFFVITFAISWTLWLPQLLISNNLVQLPEFTGILGMLAPFGPFIAAFWLTYRNDGREAIKKLWKRGWSLNFNKIWLLPTILLLPLSALITIIVMYISGIPVQWEYGVSGIALLPTFIVIYLLNALPEEYGWRGYALGSMLTRFNALTASLILGLIWGLWHLPLHFIEGTVQYGIPVYQFVLQQMLLAILYTWLFKNTSGNVFVSILFHAIGNLSGAAIPYWTTDLGRWINFGVLITISLVILLIFGAKNLSRTAISQVE